MESPSHSIQQKQQETSSKGLPFRSPTPPMDSSSEELDDLCLDQDLDDLDNISEAPRKPHFLDYAYSTQSPIVEDPYNSSRQSSVNDAACSTTIYSSENIKIDKKYERDGEISDYELAASDKIKMIRKEKSITKMSSLEAEKPISNYTAQRRLSNDSEQNTNTGARRKKHFLEENPVQPEYERIRERDHKSLDRTFDRLTEFDSLKYERKHSLDRERPRRTKEPSYSMSRFMERDASPVYRGTWPADRPNDTHSSSVGFTSMPPGDISSLGPKVECVYSLLSMLGSHDSVEMSTKFFELSRTPETCAALRRSGCIPLLVQMMHSVTDEGARKRAGVALHNVVHCHPDDKAGRREAKVLRLIEQIIEYCDHLKIMLKNNGESIADDSERHPSQAISSLMKISFDEEHRHAMCQLGALQAIINLVYLDHAAHGFKSEDQRCISLRRYAGMALTNLTFGDGNNKALLCSNKEFMKALVAQLDSSPDDLLQVTASVLRNLSWRADNDMKAVLNEISTVTALAKAAMKNKNENTLKSILSALWNLSAHCSTNKAECCAVDGALAFLVDMLTFDAPSKTLTIVENAGGILRNVSSHIAVREDYRKILRQRNCLGILLQQLKSESLTVVSNACGTLWNLSARCPEDQKYLWDNGAVPMLRSLIHSKHKMISNGSNAALKNLLNFRPTNMNQNNLDPITRSMGLKELPTLNVRKQRALEQELDQNLSETCENIDVTTPPKEDKISDFSSLDTARQQSTQRDYVTRLSRSTVVSKSESRDSINSAKSDTAYEKIIRRRNAQLNNSNSNESVEPVKVQNFIKLEEESVTQSDTVTKYENKEESKSEDSLENITTNPPSDSEEYANRNKYVESGYDLETDNDQPINYSIKYSEAGSSKTNASNKKTTNKPSTASTEKEDDENIYGVYQETDLDQITDYSLRYAENHTDTEDKTTSRPQATYGNEIILILEDSVKCYQTEGTPYAISNATSMSDLRTKEAEKGTTSAAISKEKVKTGASTVFSSGINSPEKPINYCEEGTPGYFSRRDSLSSLDEPVGDSKRTNEGAKARLPPNQQSTPTSVSQPLDNCSASLSSTGPTTPAGSSVPKAVTFVDFAQETPLMFSRHSSMQSLDSAEPACIDDRSSVVSDFSRLASGIISPSELPDSPTQSVPQSPRRITGSMPNTPPVPMLRQDRSNAPRLRSVFEDDFNTFEVENTPAQFSCATSLSNLSLDDEPKITTDCLTKEMKLMSHPSEEHDDTFDNQIVNSNNVRGDEFVNTNVIPNTSSTVFGTENDIISDGEESANDDLLLATCINIGMNRVSTKIQTESKPGTSNINNTNSSSKQITSYDFDNTRQYYTENTPAFMSKAGSNSDLSILSLDTNKPDTAVLSDDSSNTSDIGVDGLLEECIRNGMQKPLIGKPLSNEEQRKPLVIKENPIGMMRSGGNILPPYLPVRDEMNKFNVEDSPCNFSVVSGLSDITVGSGVAGLAKIKRNQSTDQIRQSQQQTHSGDESLSSISIDSEDDGNILSQAIAAGCNVKPKHRTQQSSSDIQDNASLPTVFNEEQTATNVIESGINALSLDHNDSLSSIESCESNENHVNFNALLQQCIHSGMNKEPKKPESKSKPIPLERQSILSSSPKRSQLPSYKSPARVQKDRIKERDKKDEQLLKECIDTGISKTLRGDSQIKPPTRHTRQVLAPTDYTQRLANLNINATSNTIPIPKNGETTSVAVSVTAGAPSTASGVETEHQSGTDALKDAHSLQNVVLMKQNGYDFTRIGKNNLSCATGHSLLDRCDYNILDVSHGSLNLSLESNENILEQSNEYPALKFSNNEFSDESVHESSMEMEASNEYMIEDQSETPVVPKIDKHKDPDLMLKSVERLTQELVSTAEYLRTTGSQRDDEVTTVYEKKSSNSNSNNTWNEDTCPNDVSFPSISMTAPMIASMNDDDATFSDINVSKSWQLGEEQTPTNEMRDFQENYVTNTFSFTLNSNEKNIDYNSGDFNDGSFNFGSMNGTVCYKNPLRPEANLSQPESLETESDTLILSAHSNENLYPNNGIHFKLGGEVNNLNIIDNVQGFISSSGALSLDTSSTMTNSTIIAMEAQKLANELRNLHTMTDSTSSLDLDNIRPPSVMDCLSMSGYFEVPQSPLLSAKTRKKSLPAGLMARRALSHTNGSGSLESVNSSCNLDNIKPPSIMDELLDSMISVDSITSEVADSHTSHLDGTSHYETALSENDDTITLQSCLDMPMDSTPVPSDFSSAESTPKKIRVRKILTPKQRRQLLKDRYRTYTIAANKVLIEQQANDMKETMTNSELLNMPNEEYEDEILQIELNEAPKKITPRQRRQEDRARFQTQVLNTSDIVMSAISSEDGRAYRRQQSDNTAGYRTRTVSAQENESLSYVLAGANVVIDTINNTKIKSDENLLDENSDCISLVSNDEEDEMSSIRALTSKFKFLNDMNVNNIPNTNEKQKFQNFKDDARQSGSDLTSIEYFDQNSETESCDQNIEEPKTPVMCRPRIVKPNESSEQSVDSNEEVCKSPDKIIRGRKKAAYVSPYKRTSITNVSPKKTQAEVKKTISSPPIAIPKFSTKNENVAKTHVFINKSRFTNKTTTDKIVNRPGYSNMSIKPTGKPILSKPFVKLVNGKAGEIKNPSKTIEVKPKIIAKVNGLLKAIPKGTVTKVQQDDQITNTLEITKLSDRQGTFIKDEPSISDVPIVTSEPSSPAKSRLPTKLASPSKIPKSPAKTVSGFVSRLKIPLQKSASMDTGKTTPSLQSRILSLRTNTSVNDASKRRSIGSVVKSPSVSSVPLTQRSNSNTSMKSSSSKPSTTSPPTRSNTTINNPKGTSITSRITGLWRRSEGSGVKQQISSQITQGEKLSGKPPVASKLIRSSTFDSTPEKGNSSGTAQRSNIGRYSRESSGSNLRYPVKSPSTNGIKYLAGAPTIDLIQYSQKNRNIDIMAIKKAKEIAAAAAASKGTTIGTNADGKRISRIGNFAKVDGDCKMANQTLQSTA